MLCRAGEMAQWLSALVALPEDPGSIPSTHMVTYNYLQLQFQGIRHPHTDIHTGKIPIKMKINK